MIPTTPARGSTMKRNHLAYETPQGQKFDQHSSPGYATTTPARTLFKNSASSAPLEAPTPFKKRINAGETIWCMNENIPRPSLPIPGALWDSRATFLFNLENKKFSYRTLYQKLSEASEVHDDRIDELSKDIQQHYSLPDEAFGDPSISSPSEIVAVGRIVSDSLEGKFNPSSILLESSRMTGAGARTPLKLDRIPSFAFFPGQIVAVKGVNSSGNYFQVHKVLEPPILGPASTAPEQLVEISDRLAAGPLTVFMASGPYTTTDNLDFEALDELCNKAAEQKPDVVILMGPFIDSEHPMVQNGDFDLEDVDMMIDGTVDDLFREKISRKISRIQNSLVLMIPSLRDSASKHCAFPQEGLKRKVLRLPDVCPLQHPSNRAVLTKATEREMSTQPLHVLNQRAGFRNIDK